MFYRKAVLIIHGFAGGTYDQEPLFYHLQPKLEFDVYNFTLPGHITNLSSNVEYQDWIDAVDSRIAQLKNMGYKKIYLIGHSMGGVLATLAAIKHPIVKKLILVAPAFQVFSTDDGNTIKKAIKQGPEIFRNYRIKEIISRFLKVSISQAREFLKFIDTASDYPCNLTIPTLIIQGIDDEIVPFDSSVNVYNKMKCKKWLITIDGINHDVFRGIKVNEINKEIYFFLKKNNYRAENVRKW